MSNVKIPATQMLPQRDRDKLEKALCTLVDHEGDLADAAGKLGINLRLGDVCQALRLLVDGEA